MLVLCLIRVLKLPPPCVQDLAERSDGPESGVGAVPDLGYLQERRFARSA